MVEEIICIPERSGCHEVSVGRDWLRVKKGSEQVMVALTDLVHCMVSCDTYYEFRVITKDKKWLRFVVRNKDGEAKRLYWILQRHCAGFRDLPSTYTPHIWSSSYFYQFDRNELVVEYEALFSKKRKTLYRISTRDVIGVTQHHSEGDPEAADSYYLRVFTVNGRYEDIPGNGIMGCYQMALNIKDLAPQVRYSIFSGSEFLR